MKLAERERGVLSRRMGLSYVEKGKKFCNLSDKKESRRERKKKNYQKTKERDDPVGRKNG